MVGSTFAGNCTLRGKKMRVGVKSLGLSAYMRIKGIALLGFDDAERAFIFETDRTEHDWHVEYMNTECYRHDTEIMNMRKLLRG